LIELADGVMDNRGRLHLAGVTTVMVYAGFGFGPITSAVYERFGPSPLVVPYLVHAGTTLVVLAGMWLVPETKSRDPEVSLRPRLGIPSSARSTFLTVLAPAAIWIFGFPSTSFALFPVILRDAIGGTNDVLVAGVTGTTTALAALLSRPVLRRVSSSIDGLKIAMWIGVVGYVLGTTAFVTDTWQLIPVAAIALGAASGTLLTAGLAITEALADPSNRGALNATFYFAAYIGMAMPVVITFMARGTSLNVSLGAVTAAALLVALRLTVRTDYGPVP
jgi:hypothetical protein